MGTPFERSLRGTTTPRNKVNNRYGLVGTGSRGPMDADELEAGSPAGSESSSPSVTRNTTPRQGGRYAPTFNTMHGFGTGTRSTPRTRSALAPAGRPPVPRQNSTVDGDGVDAASVAESDDVSVMTEDDYGPQEGDSVQVFVRVRPINDTEAADADGYTCTRLYGERSVSVDLKSRVEPYHFKFDCVLPEATTQEEVFERAGKPIVDNCMGGYNSSIFAYGQTGAGKTYTMQGPLSAALQDDNPQRGLAPRVFQYLFQEIDKAQDENCHENLTFSCRCSMLEIYNEVITDLINPAGTNLQIREDIKRGCYVEDLSEHTVQNVSDAMALMRKGAENRHTGETRLNRESSRSHSVFTCVLERQSKNQATGITNVLFSRLNLIDLAGSERVHGGEHGGSQATGKHFKEACHINKSLTTLGRVITELVEAQRSGQGRGTSSKVAAANRNRHVPYRDSRLTFLLQDSLGGNAKTLMIANISPCSVSGAETLSTLQFMSRAKCIRNRAKINLDAQGDVGELQREIARLNVELDNLRKGYTEPAIQEAKQLREELSKMRASRGETEIRLVNLEKENQNLKNERRRLDNKLAQVQKGSNELGGAMIQLYGRMNTYEEGTERSLQLMQEIWHVEQQLLQAKLQDELEAAQQRSQGAEELQQAVEQLQDELQQAQAAAASSGAAAEASAAELAAVRSELAAEQQQTSNLAQEVGAAQQQAAGLVEQLNAAEQQSATLAEQLSGAQQELDTAQQEAATAVQELAAARQQADSLQEQVHCNQQRIAELEGGLSTAQQDAAALTAQLAASQKQAADTQAELATAQQEAAGLQEQLAASRADAADLQAQLSTEQERSAGLATQLEAVTQQHAEAAQQLQAAQQEAADVAKRLQEELDALQGQLSASTAQVEALQQDLESSKAEAQGLREAGEAMRQRLSEQQEDTAQAKQALSDVQQQLAATQKELAEAKEMATCSEAEAGKRLAEALGAADTARQALEDERSTNASLQEQLQAVQGQLAQVTQELQEEAQARKQEADAAAASAAASDAMEQQLREQLEAVQQLLGTKQEDLGSLVTEKQELQSRLGLKQQQCSELQQQLEAEQGRSAEGRTQVAALEEAMAELNTAVKDRSAALEAAQEQIKQLQQAQQQKEDALAAATAKHEQLSADLSTLREGSKVKAEELMKQVTEVHMQLSASQQEQERLQEELDGLRNDNSALQAQLADAQGETDNFRGQASSKGLEVELLHKKLSAADANISTLRADLVEAQQEAGQLRQQVQAMESVAGESQAAAEEQLSDLKRLLLDKDQVLQEYEYERGQMQRRMEELGQRLADKSSSLEGSRSEIQALKATIRDQSNAARRQEAALADQNARTRQLQAENASLSGRLQEVSEQLADREAELRLKLNSNELQLKEQIVYNARNRQAMNEIRKVINWAQQLPAGAVATTPPHPSRPSSSASRRHHHAHLEAGSIPGSPASSHYGDLLAVETPCEVHEQGEEAGRGVPPALLLPGGQLSHQGSGGSNSSSSRHHGSHSHSRHHQQQHHHLSQGEHRYGEAGAGSASGEVLGQGGRAGSFGGGVGSRGRGVGRGGSGSPSKLAARAGEMMPLTLHMSEDLAVEHTAAHEPAAAPAYAHRDTAGGAPASPALSDAALSSACMSLGAGSRARGHRASLGSPTRSSGSKQQLAAALAAAAAQHRLPPDQQQHHVRGQERYGAAAEVEDDTLAPPGPEGSFDEDLDGRSEPGDNRALMAPQQASSPVPPSPSKECHGSISRSRTVRDNSGRRGLRAGCSDAHSFASLSDKRHKMTPGEAHPVVLSVSGEWSAGAHDSIPDMRLPAAIVGDDGSQA